MIKFMTTTNMAMGEITKYIPVWTENSTHWFLPMREIDDEWHFQYLYVGIGSN